jgi:hypothetical protein
MGFSIKKLFSKRRSWNGTPEMFLAFVMEIQAMNIEDYSEPETIQLGQVMQKLIKLNLSPYENFGDLLKRGKPDFSIIEEMRKKMAETGHYIDLKKAIYGEKVDLDDDDVMKSDSDGAKFARKFIQDLSKYVDIKDKKE